MIANNLFAILAFCLSLVYAQTYANSTTGAAMAASSRTTLAPFSVETKENTMTYQDESTTFYVTTTYYSTHWFTVSARADAIAAAATSTTVAPVTSSQTTYLDTSSPTFTSTVTSILRVTVSNSDALYDVNKAANQGNAIATNSALSPLYSQWNSTSTATLYSNSTSASCEPVTEFVTITADPTTEYVTVTAEPVTQFVTVTADVSGAPWSNNTANN